jgi:hydrogenase nickel incorporation protein HypA/HybF
MSIVQALIEQVEAEVEKAGQDCRVIGLDLVVGRLSGVHADSIRFAFEVLAPGTIVEGSTLRVSEPAAYSQCRACGARVLVEDLTMACPRCGSGEIVIDGGRELLLQSIELETNEDRLGSSEANP